MCLYYSVSKTVSAWQRRRDSVGVTVSAWQCLYYSVSKTVTAWQCQHDSISMTVLTWQPHHGSLLCKVSRPTRHILGHFGDVNVCRQCQQVVSVWQCQQDSVNIYVAVNSSGWCIGYVGIHRWKKNITTKIWKEVYLKMQYSC